MQGDLIQLALANPTSAVCTLGTIGVLVFNAGSNWSNFRYLKANCITKKDLKIELAEFHERVRNEFMTRQECEKIIHQGQRTRVAHVGGDD